MQRYSLPVPAEQLLRDDLKLGYADVYPQSFDQEEDKLTELTVRSGLTSSSYLQSDRNEVLSAIEIFGEQLLDQHIIASIRKNLSGLLRKTKEIRVVTRPRGKINFRCALPVEEMLRQIASSDSIRSLCQNSCLDPKLKNVVFSEFVKYNIPKNKASWLIKLLWYNERMEGIDKLSEWTRAVTVLLTEQLSTVFSRSSSDAKKPELKKELTRRWRYSLSLVKWLYDEGMIDQRNFLIWSLNELKKANFDQTTMLMPLFIFLAPEVSRSRTLIRHFFDISVAKMKRLKCLRETIEGSLIQDRYLHQVTKEVFLDDPNNIISPVLQNTLPSELTTNYRTLKGSNGATAETPIVGLFNSFINDMLQKNETDTVSTLLDSVRFAYKGHNTSALIKIIVKWAISSKKHSFERIALAQQLIDKLFDFENTSLPSSHQILQSLLDSLLYSEYSQGEAFLRLVLLYRSLIMLSRFSYGRLVQRLIACGIDYPAAEKNFEMYIRLLVELPVARFSLSDMNSRNSVLSNYMDLAKEEADLSKARGDIVRLLPGMFKNGVVDTSLAQPIANNLQANHKADIALSSVFDTCSLHNKSVIGYWLHQQVTTFTVQNSVVSGSNWRSQISGLPVGASLLNSRQFITIVWIFKTLQCEDLIIDTSLWLLKAFPNRLLVLKIVDIFRWYHIYLLVTGKIPSCFQTLWDWFDACRDQRQKGKRGSSELCVLRHLSFLGTLKDSNAPKKAIDQIKQELENEPKKPPKDPAVDFQEIKALHDDPLAIATAVSNLAYRYSFCKEASKKIFMYSMDVLRKQCTVPDFKRRCEIIVEVLRDYNEYGGYLEGIIVEYLQEIVRTGKIADLARPSYTVAPQLQVGWFTNVLFQFIVQRCCGFDSVLNFLQPYLKLLVRDFPTVKTPDLDTLNFLFSLVYICFATGVSTKVLVFQLTREDLHSLEASRSFEMKTPSNVDLMSDLFISALKIYSIAKSEKSESVLAIFERFFMPLLQPDSWAMTYYGTNTALATDKLVMRLMESFRDYVKLKEPSQKQKIQTQKMVKLGQWKEYLYVSFEFLQNIIGLLLEGELVKNDVLRLSESRAEFLKHALQSLDAETAFLKKYQIRYLWDQILFMDPRFIGDQASCPEVIEAVNLVDSLATFFFENPQAGFAFSEHMEFFPQGFHVLMLRSLQKYLEPLNAVDAQLARVLPTSESSDVIVYLLCGCISNLSIMKSKPQSNGLDSVDLELKVLGSWLSKDLTGFLSQIKIYNTMEAFNLSLTAALQSFTEMDTSDNYALRRPEEATPTPGSIFISDIRRRLLNHLRLISAMLSTIAANWKEFDLITYIQTFIMLSSTRVVSGENTGVLRLSIIGLASWMCDEVSNSEFNKMLLNKLKECQSRLDVNANGSEMISRLLPFQVNNPYMSNIIGVVRRDSDLTGGPVLVSPYKTGYRPTEWLEMLDFLSNTGSESFAGAGLKSNVQEHVSSIPLSLFNATEVTYSSNTYEEIFHDSWIKPLESSAQFNWCTIPNGPRQDNSTLRHDAQTSMAMDVDVELSSFTKKRADGGDESDRAVKRHRFN